jgi:hypothetical protein
VQPGFGDSPEEGQNPRTYYDIGSLWLANPDQISKEAKANDKAACTAQERYHGVASIPAVNLPGLSHDSGNLGIRKR